jgi:ABC-type multidrug transport system fused ATPase/permease subunit
MACSSAVRPYFRMHAVHAHAAACATALACGCCRGVVIAGVCAAVVALSLFRNLGWFAMALSASTRLNGSMLASVLRARLSFFHVTPTGRILNVFSKDQGSMDEQLPQVTFDSLQTISVTIGAVVLISIANFYIIPIFLPLAYLFLRIRQYYLASSRDVKRLEAVTRSPVYAMFSATIKGLPTIRAFGATPRFRASFLSALDVNGSWWMGYICCARCAAPACMPEVLRGHGSPTWATALPTHNHASAPCPLRAHSKLLSMRFTQQAADTAAVRCRWVGARMDAIAFALLATAALASMAAKSVVTSTLLALALTHLLQLSGSMQWAVRQTAEAENHMTSVERALALTHLPQERPATVASGGAAPPPGWPASARLQFDAVEARPTPYAALCRCSRPGGTHAAGACAIASRCICYAHACCRCMRHGITLHLLCPRMLPVHAPWHHAAPVAGICMTVMMPPPRVLANADAAGTRAAAALVAGEFICMWPRYHWHEMVKSMHAAHAFMASSTTKCACCPASSACMRRMHRRGLPQGAVVHDGVCAGEVPRRAPPGAERAVVHHRERHNVRRGGAHRQWQELAAAGAV